MTTEEKAQAFLEGRYAKGESGQNAGPGGRMPDENGPDGNEMPGEKPEGAPAGSMPARETLGGNAQDDLVTSGMGDEVGTPDAGTTQSAGTKTDSSSYSSYEEMLESYESDIASIEDGDKYGNNIVDLYNPINYIGDEDTESPTWTRIVMGASEGDMSLFAFMNMQIAWINSGTDAKLEWQWDGGHVPSEIFGESLALYVDEMYGKYVEGAAEVTKADFVLHERLVPFYLTSFPDRKRRKPHFYDSRLSLYFIIKLKISILLSFVLTILSHLQ